jgi:hypothetical protein
MPRTFPSGDAGYHNASLGTAGVAVAFPNASARAVIAVSAGCFLGFRNSNTLATFNDTNYGSISGGAPFEFERTRDGSQTHIHLAPWTATAIVSILFD